jgi:hypothetical protein
MDLTKIYSRYRFYIEIHIDFRPQLSKIDVTLCRTVLFRWYCEYPSPIVPSPKVELQKRRHPEKRRKKVNSRGPNRHFDLRWPEITDFACMQINVIFKSQFIRHIKNTCTNCTQNSHVFRTWFSHFFAIFLRICKNCVTLEHHSLKAGLKTLKGKYTRHFYIQNQLIFIKNHAFFTFSIKLTSKLESKILRRTEKKWWNFMIFHLFSKMCQSHLLEWGHKSARIA